jgi:hypothetical protein
MITMLAEFVAGGINRNIRGKPLVETAAGVVLHIGTASPPDVAARPGSSADMLRCRTLYKRSSLLMRDGSF